MIHVHYTGRLGNRLFQFALGLVLSHLSGSALATFPIEGFSGTKGYATPSISPKAIGVTEDLLRAQGVEKVAELAKSSDLIVTGWPHCPEYYSPYKDLISSKLTPDDGKYFVTEVPVIHLRLGDYFSGSPKTIEEHAYPIETIASAARSLGSDECYLLTDEPSSPRVAKFLQLVPGCSLAATGDSLHDYRTLYNAKTLVCSPSTFSWWAAWTGKADKILMPRDMACWKPGWHPLYAVADSRVSTFSPVDGQPETPINSAVGGQSEPV